MANFSANVDKWVRKTKQRQETVFRLSTQKISDAMTLSKFLGGNMPVKTGNLRRSLRASTSARPNIKRGVVEFTDNAGQIELVIAGAKVTDKIYLGFQAEYAKRVNYGFTGIDKLGRSFNQTGANFVGLAVQRWPEFVRKSVAEAKR